VGYLSEQREAAIHMDILAMGKSRMIAA